MDNPLSQVGSSLRRSGAGGLLTGLRVFGRLLDWVRALVELSEEEQHQAGVYLGYRRRW